jgi:bifunctional ADP-heptose synthase (sugar kinase/adenylyltransferase)
VDRVVLFAEDTPLALITLLTPDILVKGGDYQLDEIVGREVVLARGGRVVALPFVPGYSTTRLIDRIRSGT